MDPYVLSSLIGGGTVNLGIWGTLLVLVLRDKRRKKRGDGRGKTWNQRVADGDI